MSLPKYISDLAGTKLTSFLVGSSLLKYISGGFAVRNQADSADAALTASQMLVSGNNMILNSDAAGSGADWTLTFARPAAGMTAAWTFTLPIAPGTSGQVLQTDGAGNTSWITPASGASNMLLTDDTALVFGSTATVALVTKPALAKIRDIRVYVDTAFNTAATVSIGVSGTLSKYGSTGQVDLTTVGLYTWDPGVDVVAGSEAIIATYSAAAASVGAARIEIDYVIPT